MSTEKDEPKGFGFFEGDEAPPPEEFEDFLTRHGTARTSVSLDFDAIQATLRVSAGLVAGLPAPVELPSLVVREASGQVHAFQIKSGLRVGRREAEVVLRAPELSSHHFTVAPRGGSGEEAEDMFIEDHGSKNGTWVNRRRIHHPERLRVGDLVEAGGVQFTLVLPLEEFED